MGICRICQRPACFGFSEGGPYSQRKRKGYVWACAEHRAEVEAQCRAAFHVQEIAAEMPAESRQVDPLEQGRLF